MKQSNIEKLVKRAEPKPIQSSKKDMTLTYFLLFIVLFSGLAFFYMLTNEFQPWDELLYVARAKAILNYSCWADQTKYSLGGLYSSSHPPLYIWFAAIFAKIIGDVPLAYRLPSFIASIATMCLIFFSSNNKRAALYSCIILGIMPVYSWFASMGQLDVFLSMFIISSLILYNKYLKSKKRSILIAASALFGFALLSKIIVGMLIPFAIITYAVVKIIRKEWKTDRLFRDLLYFAFFGAIIALPWHIFMLIKFGMKFIDNFFLIHIFSRSLYGVEQNIKALGPLYYINQIIIFSPFVGFAFKNFKQIFKSDTLIYWSLCIVGLLIFTLSQTKLATYTITFIPALAILIGVGIDSVIKEKRISSWLLQSLVVGTLWANSQSIRSLIKTMMNSDGLLNLIVIAFVVIALVQALVWALKKWVAPLHIVLAFILFLSIRLIYPGYPKYSTEIEKISYKFKSANYDCLIYAESENASIVTNPQINHYFDLMNNKNIKFFKVNSFDSLSKLMDYKGKKMILASKIKPDKNMEEILMHPHLRSFFVNEDNVYSVVY